MPIRDLALQVQKSGKTGWYFRVLQEGYVQPNLPLILCNSPLRKWTIARANQIMHYESNNKGIIEELASCLLLSTNWQQTLKKRVLDGTTIDCSPRLWGS